MIFDLIRDFADVLEAMPPEHPRHRILKLLDEAIRRDVHFIDRHPTTFFQCMWNTCWWYDCPDAVIHFEQPEGGFEQLAPTRQYDLKLHQLLDHWNAIRSFEASGAPWLCAIRPPAIRLGTAQQVVLNGHGGTVNSVAFSPTAERVVIGSSDGTVRVWDLRTGKELFVLGINEAIESVAYSPNGRQVVFGAADNVIRIWDEGASKASAELRGHEGTVCGVAFHPDGDRIVSGALDDTVRIWDLETVSECNILRGHQHAVGSVAFSPNGERTASGSWDETMRAWDSTTGAEVAVLTGHNQSVSCVQFSPNSQRIVSGSWDRTVRIWQAVTGENVLTLYGHEGRVQSVAFSPGGRRVASASEDNTVRVWDAKTGECLEAFPGGCDVRAMVTGFDRLQFRTLPRGEYKDFVCMQNGKIIAWFPLAISKFVTSPKNSQLVAGAIGCHLQLLELRSYHRLPVRVQDPNA